MFCAASTVIYARQPSLEMGALLFSPLTPRVMGVVLVLLALWLLTFELALGGLRLLMELPVDMALHAVFVGFVFSMVFGHAPVILPAVLRVRFPYHPALYVPLALLHVSLAVRVFLSVGAGAWGNAAAIALFIATTATLVLPGVRNPVVGLRSRGGARLAASG